MQSNLNKFADLGWNRITNIKISDLVDFREIVRGLNFNVVSSTLFYC